jgi:chromosome partitioning protein
MAKVIVLAGDKGGSGKTTSSHAIAHGLAMHGIRAFHISTDARREILPAETRRYATLDGRNPATLGAILDKLAPVDDVVVLIDGGGGRPDIDAVLSQAADLTILPFMQSQTDLRVARADLDRLPEAVGLPNRWPSQKWARDVADRELGEELDPYMHRLMSPVPEINGYVSLLRDTGAVAKINPACKALALRVLERMGLSLYSFKAPEAFNAAAQ